jgi:serine/threonine-protein kinase
MGLPAPPPGTLLAGKYRLEREIGRGGMGVVYEATHLTLGTLVAVKLLLVERGMHDVQARFEREARVAAQVASAHVARVTDFGTEGDTPFLVMELLRGHDLEQELEQRGRIPLDEAIEWILQAALGVAEAHAKHLVHRDLKPSNLFLVETPMGRVVKVLDFGLTKVHDVAGAASLTGSESSFGTPSYMAPEQIISAKRVDARCDQHALAMILYEMLSGQPPYLAGTVPELFVVIATAPAPDVRALLPEVPAPLAQALSRALSKKPEGRFASLRSFSAALAACGTPRAAQLAQGIAALLPADADAAAGAAPGTTLVDPNRAAHAPTQPPVAATAPDAGEAASDESDKARRRAASPLGMSAAAVSLSTSSGDVRPRQRTRVLAAVALGAAAAAVVASILFWRAGHPVGGDASTPAASLESTPASAAAPAAATGEGAAARADPPPAVAAGSAPAVGSAAPAPPGSAPPRSSARPAARPPHKPESKPAPKPCGLNCY